jgi:hypothetical protein
MGSFINALRVLSPHSIPFSFPLSKAPLTSLQKPTSNEESQAKRSYDNRALITGVSLLFTILVGIKVHSEGEEKRALDAQKHQKKLSSILTSHEYTLKKVEVKLKKETENQKKAEKYMRKFLKTASLEEIRKFANENGYHYRDYKCIASEGKPWNELCGNVSELDRMMDPWL